ncbi:MAG: restriction endonuclease subunit S [Patescibacteria group bacterium]
MGTAIKRNNWKREDIKEVCFSIVDCINKTAHTVDVKTPYKMLRTTNIKNGWIDLETVRCVTEDTYNKWTRRQVPKKGDVILTREAPLGEVGLLRSEDKVFLGQRLVAYRANPEKLDNKFLLYSFLSHDLISQIKSLGSGAIVEHMRVPDAEKLTILMPDIDAQKAISSIIGAYDDLLENNKKRINALEEMAQLLYTEWFVKLEFPGHEKAKIVDSRTEYGMIPEGWEVKRLDEVIRIVRGRSYSSEQISDTNGDYYIVNLKSFNRGGGFRLNGAKYYSGQVSDNQLLKQGDIVVAVTDMTNDRAVIARPARIPNISTHKTTLSADVVKIVADGIPSSFIYYCLLDHRFTEATKHKANGANVLHLKPSAIGEYRALIPPIHLLKQFDALCNPSFGLIDKIIAQNADVEKMRDLLIPQLVTGKRILK